MQHRDPVCGKTITDAEVAEVDAGTSKYATKKLHNGKWHYFCGLLCRMKFAGNPSGYLAPTSAQKTAPSSVGATGGRPSSPRPQTGESAR